MCLKFRGFITVIESRDLEMKKIWVIIGALLLMVMLVACHNNGIHDEPDPQGVLGSHTILA